MIQSTRVLRVKIPPLGPWHSRRKGLRDSRNECPRPLQTQCDLKRASSHYNCNTMFSEVVSIIVQTANDIEAWTSLNYSIMSQRKTSNSRCAILPELDLIQTNVGAKRKNGRLNSRMRWDHKLLREIPRWRDTSVETPVPSREGRIAGRWTRITNDAVAGKKGRGLPILYVLRQILTDIIRHIARDGQHLSNHAQPVESPFPFRFQSANARHSTNINRVAEVRRLTLWH